MESSSCTRPHFQGRAWPPRPPPAARDPPSHSSSSAIVVVPAMPPPGHPAATAPPSRCRSPRRSSSCSRLTRGPCCRSRPLEGRPRPCSAAMFAQPLPLLLLLLPSLLLATVAQRGAKRWWTRNARNGALHNGPAQHSLGRRQPSGRGPLVLPPHHLIRRPRCTLRALVDEKRQERGPVKHGPGRCQPGHRLPDTRMPSPPDRLRPPDARTPAPPSQRPPPPKAARPRVRRTAPCSSSLSLAPPSPGSRFTGRTF